jgi:hypothetical protein
MMSRRKFTQNVMGAGLGAFVLANQHSFAGSSRPGPSLLTESFSRPCAPTAWPTCRI